MADLYINMFGEFTLKYGENTVCDSNNRTKKGWLLLAYLLCHKGRIIPQRELIRLLWGDVPASSKPENVLRITMHRLRAQLNGLWPTAGNDLILFKENGYYWNTAIPVMLDYEEFDRLCRPADGGKEYELQNLLQAIELYRGSFFEKQNTEPWIIPTVTHYHNKFIEISAKAAKMLLARDDYSEAAAICQKAISHDPYDEELYRILMESLAAANNFTAVGEVYGELRKKLFNDFGIFPAEETKAVYRKVTNAVKDTTVLMDDILEHLVEPDAQPGAMECDYESFKVLCYALVRSMSRSGKVAHVVMLSVTDGVLKPLSKRSIHRVLNQLGEQIRCNLRLGDFFSRISTTQYIIVLPEANYENSCMIARRIISAFFRKHPHVTAKINFMVQPLEPNLPVPQSK